MSKEIVIDKDTDFEKTIRIPYINIDDIDTVQVRVASELNIPLKFLMLEDNSTTAEEKDVKLSIPFKRTIKKVALSDIEKMNISFSTLESTVFLNKKKSLQIIINKAKEFIFNTSRETDEKFIVCAVFYYLFGKPDNANLFDEPSSNLYRENIDLIFSFISYIDSSPFFGTLLSFQRQYDQFVTKINKEIKETDERSNDINELNNLLKENRKPAREVKLSISRERIKFVNSKIVLSPFYKDEMELFDKLRLSRDMPFASVAGFSKVLKSFVPPEEFTKQLDKRFAMFILNKKNETVSNLYSLNSYSIIYISRINDQLEISIDSKVEGISQNVEVREEVIIERIINALNIATEIPEINCEIIPQYYKGDFYIPNLSISRLVMQDIIMNNDFISKMFVVNEQFTTISKKGGISVVYLPSDNENKNFITSFTITNGVVSSANKRFIKGTPLRLGDIFLGISFKTKNNYTLGILKECMSQMIAIYKKNEKEVIEEYKVNDCDFSTESKLIDNIEKIEVKKAGKKSLKLRDYLPDVFVTNYPAVCGKQPYIVEDEDEAGERIEKGEDIMKYPLYNEFEEYYYSCNNHKEEGFIYPGLKKTRLSEYLLPCCFTTPQSEKSLRGMYEKGIEEEEEKEKKKEADFKIYKTSKIMPVGGVGFLSVNIDKLFSIIDPSNTYLRSGVSVGVNSCLEAIIRASQTEEQINKLSKKDREKYLEDYRKRIIDVINKGASSQNTYQYSTQSLIDFIRSDSFLDIRLLQDALEDLFQVHLLVFQVNKENLEGELIPPYYINNLYTLMQKRKYRYTVILYETMGSRIDNLFYPHYEFISRYRPNFKKISSVFPTDDIISNSLNDIYEGMFIKYSKQLNTKLLENPFNTPIRSQRSDSSGKIRVLSFTDGTSIFVQPMDSLPSSFIQDNRNAELVPVNYEKALSFLEKESVKDYIFAVVQDNVVGINASKNNLRFYIPIITVNNIEFINTVSNVPAPSFILDEDIITSFAKREKSARNLIAVCMYLFSSYISSNKKSIEDDALLQTVIDFRNDKISIDANIKEEEYSNIQRKFVNNRFISEDKIVVKSKEIEKKIVYSLFVKTRQNSEYIRNYSTLEFIPDFYQDERDFTKDESSLLFISIQAIDRWRNAMARIKESKVFTSIDDDFINSTSSLNITLFSNERIMDDKDLYLCVKANSINSAVAFFDILNNSNRADIQVARSSSTPSKRLFNKYRGKMVFVNDVDGSDITVKSYGDESNCIMVFKLDNEINIICLFKYKLG